jgi:hypothetical protein
LLLLHSDDAYFLEHNILSDVHAVDVDVKVVGAQFIFMPKAFTSPLASAMNISSSTFLLPFPVNVKPLFGGHGA